MFTGIIEEIGVLSGIHRGERAIDLTISCSRILEDVKLGDSVAVNGICLTVKDRTGRGFAADVMTETVRRSSLGEMRIGMRVNLERAMSAAGRFGGHIVSGHVDGIGIIRSMEREGNAVWITVGTDERLLRYILEKGSIAIDGISLTVAAVEMTAVGRSMTGQPAVGPASRYKKGGFAVSVIPHTGRETTLLERRVGDAVNLECDVVGKYIERFIQCPNEGIGGELLGGTEGITLEFLGRHGF